MQPALLVVDMIRDFVTGRLGSEPARALVRPIRDLLAWARFHRIPVAFVQDAHAEGDPELPIWGEHAMAGSEGAETVAELAPRPGELVLHKHVYSGFHGTDLAERLRERRVDTVLLAGVATDICVQHTAADAFFRRFKPVVLSDGTASLTPERHEGAMEYMRSMYGAEVLTSAEAKERFAPAPASRRG